MSLAEHHIGLMDDLGFAIDQAHTGNYNEALRLIGRAKIVDPRNIFVIALEKQISRLRTGGMLPREKMEILQSLPGLVDRARADSERRGVAPQTKAHPSAPAVDEKQAKLRLVVEQYFLHADEWMARGEYDVALKEVERVVLIDPGNVRAREYRSRIDQARQGGNGKAAPPSAEVAPLPHSVPLPASPAPLPEAPSLPAGGKDARKEKNPLVLYLAIGIAVIAIGIAAITFLPTKQNQPLTASELPAPPPQEQLAPVEKGQPEPQVAAPEVVMPVPPRPEKEKKSDPPKQAERPVERPKEEPMPDLVNAKPAAVPESIGKSENTSSSAPFIPVQREPKIIRLERPLFADADLAAGVKGEIVVKVQIDKAGKPVQAKVVSSSNSLLNDPVVDAVMRSSFSPGMMSNGPVQSWMTIPFRFK
jgi:periplasmic protein TonB